VPERADALGSDDGGNVDLGVSALTRRDRLERIASAERDRRAGRVDLAIAVLGEGREWPARVVIALARLPKTEGALSRTILEQSLDDWAAESGLESLSPAQAIEEAATEKEASETSQASSALDGPDAAWPVEAPTSHSEDLAAPLEHDELERAFAEAEAQTDEMLDVNEVAQRILADEPLGLAELSEDAFEPIDSGMAHATEPDPGEDALERMTASPTDAAWAAPSIWPTGAVDAEADALDGLRDEGRSGRRAHDFFDADPISSEEEFSSRNAILATLERWLGNLEKGKAGRTR